MLFLPPRPCTPSQLSSSDNTWRFVSSLLRLLGLLGLLPFDMRDLKKKKRKKKKKKRRSRKRRKQKVTRHYVQDKRKCFVYS